MSHVRYEKKDHLVTITLARPEKLNALNEKLMLELRQAWERYRDDDDAWLAILTAEGRAFSAGADKSWFEKALQGDDALGLMQQAIRKDAFWSGTLDKPTLAAVNGLAVGAAVDLVLRSDFRVAAESASFRQAEVERGNFMLFHDNLPPAIAAEMMAGFPISAQRAYDVGMINRVAPDDRLMDVALTMANELLARPPLVLHHALKLIRDLKYAGTIVPRALIDRYTTEVSRGLARTDDWKEATAALLEGKKPVFRKR
jgi:enoyl-CoA hydratase/carnithine racemase